MYKFSFFIIISIFSRQMTAQLESAMQMGTQMSLNTLQGTARYVATGGVISSVGGDFSNLSTNPAGLGRYSRSEIEFTPMISINNVNSNYMYINSSNIQSTNWENNRVKFAISSAGMVIADRVSDKDALRNSNVIIGINRTADFNKSVDFGVIENRVYSYSNYLADLATHYKDVQGFPSTTSVPTASNYYSLDNLYSRVLIAREAQLTFYNNGGYYQDPMPYNSSALKARQFGQIKTTGGITELSVAWAGSYYDKYYLGFSLGIPFLSYKSELSISEDNIGITAATPVSQYGNYRYMDLTESDYFSGAGLNLKIGGMAKLTDRIKASAYIHTPTAYQISNEYAVGMTTGYQNSTQSRSQTLKEFPFQYYSPFKVGGGLSYTFDFGFIGTEYEFTNLNNLTIGFENDPENEKYANNVLTKQNQDVHTFRVGGELNIPNFNLKNGTISRGPIQLRLGYNYRTSPTDPAYVEFKGDQVAHTISGGFGYKGEVMSIDVCYMKTQYRDYDYLYGFDNGGSTKFDYGVNSWNSINQISATLKFRLNSGKSNMAKTN